MGARPSLRRLTACLCSAALALFVALPAWAEGLIASLSTHRVLIGSNYTGAQIAVFGSVEPEGRRVARADPFDIVVTVTGPKLHLLVREKERVGLFWLNKEQRRFWEAPSFLATLTSRPFSEMGTDDDSRRLQWGLKNKVIATGTGLVIDPGETRFADALIRLKGAGQLYQEVERGVTFLTPTMYRASIILPATAPTGNYDVVVELLSGTVQLARQQTSFEVVQIGFEQQVAWFARTWSIAYGLMAAMVALLFGWLATVIFRRD